MKQSKSVIIAALVVATMMVGSPAQANFLVAETGAGKAEIYSPSGTHLNTFATGFITPIGVAEGDGFVYVSDYSGTYIYKYSTNGTPLGVINSAAMANNHGPAGLAYINGRIHGAAYNISTLTSQGPDAATEDGDPNTPLSYLYYTPFAGSVHGLASAAPNGFTDIVYYTGQNATGNGILGYWEPGLAAGDFYDFGVTTLRGVVAAGSSTLYVALYDSNKVVKVTFSGGWTATDFITNNTPVGLVIDGGNLYVSSFSDKTITGYSLVSGAQVSQFSTLGNPEYFAVVSFGGAAPSSAVLTNVTVVAGTDLRFTVSGSGTQVVQVNTNLANPGGWTALYTNTAPFVFTDTNAVSSIAKRFYRALAQ